MQNQTVTRSRSETTSRASLFSFLITRALGSATHASSSTDRQADLELTDTFLSLGPRYLTAVPLPFFSRNPGFPLLRSYLPPARNSNTMVNDVNKLNTPYPVVDADPHFNRVIRYFRPADYGVWAAGTVAAPAILYGLGASAACERAILKLASAVLTRPPRRDGRLDVATGDEASPVR